MKLWSAVGPETQLRKLASFCVSGQAYLGSRNHIKPCKVSEVDNKSRPWQSMVPGASVLKSPLVVRSQELPDWCPELLGQAAVVTG